MKRFVLYLDIEHPLSLLKHKERIEHLKRIRRNSQLFRDISGAGCMEQSFIWLDGSHLDELPLLAMIISGNRTDWENYRPSQLRESYRAIRESHIPILGICGGHQLICRALGGRVAPMRKLRDGEPDAHPDYKPGYFKERGFTDVDIRSEHGLFRGLGSRIKVHESHYCEVKKVPRGLDVLASSKFCRVQAVTHRGRSLYGVQFHPESFDDEHPDGRIVLENFFRLARSANRTR